MLELFPNLKNIWIYLHFNQGVGWIVFFIFHITELREDMDFMFEWQEQYLTSERSERMFFLLYGVIYSDTKRLKHYKALKLPHGEN